MKEIEILFEVRESKESALEKLDRFTPLGEKRVIDEYYYNPKNSNMYSANLKNGNKVIGENEITQWFRIRKSDDETFITFKKDHLKEDKTWLYSDEYETKVSDYETAKKIFQALGLLPLIVVDNKKHVFVSCHYEIVLENVKELGLFLEVELMNHEEREVDVKEERKKIMAFVDELGIKLGKELNVGKPELMLQKNKILNKK